MTNNKERSVKTIPPDDGSIIPIRGEFVPEKPGDAWSDAVKRAMYECYVQTRSVARARRWYLRQYGDDAPCPADSVIYEWCTFYDWPALVEAEYRLAHGKLDYETDRQATANYWIGLQVEADVLTGAYDDNPLVGMMRLKAVEGSTKRKALQVKTQAPKPPEEAIEPGEMSRDEREARNKRGLIQRGKSA